MTSPNEVPPQISEACVLIRKLLGSTLEAIHLYGSAVEGGLKPHSDLDLLVTVTTPPPEASRRALLIELLKMSSPPGHDAPLRPLEVTVIARDEIFPWRHPARRELQFGEWLRQDLQAGRFEPPVLDPDLAILLTKARQHSVPLFGRPAANLFEPVPHTDFVQALSDTLALWTTETDWLGDERNIVLTLARIWYSASTGNIAPKDVAANWALERLPVEHQFVLSHARAAYLGEAEDLLAHSPEATGEFIRHVKATIQRIFA
ncbi:MAG TPA: AadA family aminoglycoside 3''-O-nucleotidyltransferase [Prosthecobacter sp.]